MWVGHVPLILRRPCRFQYGRYVSSPTRAMYVLSIVIPAKDEAVRLPRTLATIARAQAQTRERWEVLVVDDGSRDQTLAVARRGVPGLEVRTLAAPSGGVGDAVRRGVAAAAGDRILLCDADGPVPFEHLTMLRAALDAGGDVAVGSRRLVPGMMIAPQPWYRLLMGKIWGRAVAALVPVGVRDTQCGFKLFRREAAQALFARSRCQSFAFHVEVLAWARRLGLSIAEVPVAWRDVPGSKVRLVREPLAMLAELVSLARRLSRAPAGSVAGFDGTPAPSQ